MTLDQLFETAHATLAEYDRIAERISKCYSDLPLVQQRRLIGERPVWADFVVQLQADEALVEQRKVFPTVPCNDVECNALAVRQLRGADAYLAARVQPEPPRAA